VTVAEQSTGTPMRGRVRVLLVEDDPAEVRLLEARMSDHGMAHLRGDVAATLADAVAKLDSEPFDVVLLDLSLPDSEGLATVTRLLEAHPEVPVVVLTGTEDDRLAAAAIEAGAQDYLVKGSVRPDVLVRVVHHARERHGLLAALQVREHRFRAMAESAQDAIYRFRIEPAFEFEYLNPAVATLSGFPLEEFYANPNLYFQRVHAQDCWKLDVRGLDPADADRSITVRFQHANGEWIVLEDHRTPIVEDGVVMAVQGVVRDVTAQQRTTRALHDALSAEQRAAEQLRAANELKGQFLQAVSHELRTPLTSIIGFSETLVTSIEHLAAWQVRSFHERILENANRLQVLMGDLLDLERLTHAELQVNRVETDITAIAAEVAQGLSLGTRQLVVEDTACVASVDPKMVERIIRNLLSNAVKHTPAHTTITVGCSQDGEVARITVVDDGPGIPEKAREEAFNPFWQGAAMKDAPSPGTGVGLSIVRQFAALHSGHAWLEDTPGGGTTVHVELSMSAAAEVHDPSPEGVQVDQTPALAQQTPALDEASWRYLPVDHRRSLQRAMVELLHATNAVEATDIIVAHLLRTGAGLVDGQDDAPAHATVLLDPDLAPVRVTHADETVRPTLAGQADILTTYARHALSTIELRPAPHEQGPGGAVVLWATRELLAANTVEELVGVVLRAVHALGGAVLPARLEDEEALPLDLTLGQGEPLVPVAEFGSSAHMLLQRHLPSLVADAREAADRLRAADRPGGDAITGLATREELQRLLARLHDDDVIVAVDLHGFRDPALDGGDNEEVVRRFATCLREQVRAGDKAARVGEDEFALLLRGAGRAGALEALQRLRLRWGQVRTHPAVSFTAGIAVVSEHDPQVLRHVERALYVARSADSGSRLQQEEVVL
jgi:PAS domain S-box-containing protein/diguanylate cyclase (GGDEF)-like protein